MTAKTAIDAYGPESPHAWLRLWVSLAAAGVLGVGMWAVVVILPVVQADFGIDRAAASLPYTATMFGFAAGTLSFGRLADRIGIAIPLALAGVAIGLGFVIAGFAPGIGTFTLAHGFLIGLGAGGGFAPLMADISHWFVKRRGMAVVVVASGNYVAGALWPIIINAGVAHLGWRNTFIAIGLVVPVLVLPMCLAMRPRLSHGAMAAAEQATSEAAANIGVQPRTLLTLLTVAGFACCVAMSMPQVHLVAYCGDLGYGVARGAEMLALMLFLGIFSRVASGFVADRIGGAATLLIGSFMQGVALLLYLFFNGLASLYVVSGIFGLFQGGIVPMYAVLCREFLPAREAGAKIGMIITATIFGMAFGGYLSGLIFDLTGSYRMAFLNGLLWNLVNVAIVSWLVWRRRGRQGARAALRAA